MAMAKVIGYIKFFSINIFVFRVLGFWKPEKHTHYKELYNSYTLVCAISWFLFLSSQAIYLITSLNGIGELTTVLFTAVTFGANFIKTMAIYRKNDEIKLWIENLHQPMLQPKCKKHHEMAQSTETFHIKLFLICLYLGVQTYLFFSILPFLKEETKMLSQGWFPFDWKKSPNYEIIYAFQNSVTFCNTIMCLNLDTFSAGLLSQIGLQCDYLIVTLNCLDIFAVENGVLLKNNTSSIESMRKDPEMFSRMMTDNLIICIEHYQKIRRLSEKIENIHETSIFFLFSGGGLIICSGLFQLTVVPIGTLEFFMVISFLVSMLTEQFLYCWFGNEIIYKSNKISDAAYNSPWLECDLRYKKILLNFLIQTRYPIEIMVGGLFSMSIEAFKSVVQSSYSCFALLKKLQDKGT